MTVEFVPQNLRNLIQKKISLAGYNNNLNKLHDSIQNFGEDSIIRGSGPTILVDPGGFVKTPDNCEEHIIMEIPDDVTEEPVPVIVHYHLQQILSLKGVGCLRSLLSRLNCQVL